MIDSYSIQDHYCALLENKAPFTLHFPNCGNVIFDDDSTFSVYLYSQEDHVDLTKPEKIPQKIQDFIKPLLGGILTFDHRWSRYSLPIAKELALPDDCEVRK